jgi:hypothetical protein
MFSRRQDADRADGGGEAVPGPVHRPHPVPPEVQLAEGIQRGVQRPRMDGLLPPHRGKGQVQDDLRLRTRDESGLFGQVQFVGQVS